MMVINSLEKMEEIVKKNRELSWDGWTVVHLYHNKVAWRYRNGVQIRGRWYVQTRFEPNERGWEIPKKFVRPNG
jgi:hypothetical protein